MLPLTTSSTRSEHLQERMRTSRATDFMMRSDVGGSRLWLEGNNNDEIRCPRNSVVRITGGIVSVNRSTNAVANAATVDLQIVTDNAGVSTLTTVPGVPVGYTVSKVNTVSGSSTEDVVSINVTAVANVQYTGTFEVTHQGSTDSVTTDISFNTAQEIRTDAE